MACLQNQYDSGAALAYPCTATEDSLQYLGAYF